MSTSSTPPNATLLGLRVDVDTHAGMRDGVPRLLDLFQKRCVRATFYFAMGPDRSGLAVLNLLKPGFLTKMRGSGAARVYGLRTMLSGTLLPSRPVGAAFPGIARRAREEGHEAGVHAWDHRRWQDRLPRLSAQEVALELDRGRGAFTAVFGSPPPTSAAPAWLTRDEALLHQETYGMAFASDCRGRGPFRPRVGGRVLDTPQVPATLPTLDEALGRTHADAPSFFADLLRGNSPGEFPVLTVHAELEGGPYAPAFDAFLETGLGRGVRFLPLGELLRDRAGRGPLPVCPMGHAPVPGRHGVVSVQGEPSPGTPLV